MLSLGVVELSDGARTYASRGYNGGAPGPLVRARAGTTLSIRLENALSATDNVDAGHNKVRLPNTTNLHTHGMHVSPRPPGDDVSLSVGPGAAFDYTYDVPADHMGGTHWYHPHHHGSVELSAGGGAAGLLIVEDEPGALPDAVRDMVETPLVLSWISPTALHELHEGADGAAVRAADDACLRDGTRGYALLAPSPAPTGAPVAPTTKPTAAPPPVVAPPADGSDGAAAAPLGVAAAVLALLLA